MRRQRNMAQMKEQIKTPEKELSKMEISNLSDAEFKTLVIRMLKELSEDLNSIKQIQSETKDIVIQIKNTLQETAGEWMKPRIKSVIWNIGRKKQPIRTRRKNNPKKQGQYKQPLGQIQEVRHLHHRGTRRKRGGARNWKSI